MKELVSRCDVCDDTDGVTTYTIIREGVDGLRQSFEIDLDQKEDAKHKQPLHKLIERYAREKVARATSHSAGGGPRERADRDLERLGKRVRGIPQFSSVS